MAARSALAATLALASGGAAVIGSLLPWAEISAGPFTEQARGIDGWEGRASLIAGIVVGLAAVRVFRGSRDAIARLRPRAAIGGLIVTGVGLYTAFTARDQLLDAAGTELPRVQVERALDSGLLELSIAVGLYVVIAGGIQGILAAVVTSGVRDEPLVSGPGIRGWARTGDAATTDPSGGGAAAPGSLGLPAPPPEQASREPEPPA